MQSAGLLPGAQVGMDLPDPWVNMITPKILVSKNDAGAGLHIRICSWDYRWQVCD